MIANLRNWGGHGSVEVQAPSLKKQGFDPTHPCLVVGSEFYDCSSIMTRNLVPHTLVVVVVVVVEVVVEVVIIIIITIIIIIIL